MLNNLVHGIPVVSVEGRTTLRKSGIRKLFIGTENRTVSGVRYKSSVIQFTNGTVIGTNPMLLPRITVKIESPIEAEDLSAADYLLYCEDVLAKFNGFIAVLQAAEEDPAATTNLTPILQRIISGEV